MSDAEGNAGGQSAIRGIWEEDAVKLTALVCGLFAAYVVGGLLLSYGLRQQLNELAQLSFFIAVFAMLALALNLHWGYTGLFNIGVIGFMGIGIYTTAILSKGASLAEPAAGTTGGFGLPLWIGIIGGVVAAGLFGGLVALPALRLRADYFAIVTVGLSEVVRFTLLESSLQKGEVAGYWVGLGGGSGLLLDFDPTDRFLESVGLLESYTQFVERLGARIGIGSNPKPVFDGILYGLILLAFLVGFYVLLRRVGSSPYGRVLKAIREDEDATKALGKDTNRFKIKAFMIGCALMGLGGILFYGSQGAITPNAFRPRITFFVWIALIIGGAGSNTGSVMGGAIFAAVLYQGPVFFSNVVEESFEIDAVGTFAQAVAPLGSADPIPLIAYTVDNIGQLRFVIMGVVLIYLMHNRPEGILGHRKEPASPISLHRRRPKASDGSPPMTDGGRGENGGIDDE